MKQSEFPDLIASITKEAIHYLEGLDERKVVGDRAADALGSFDTGFPEEGDGSTEVLHQLLAEGVDGATHSAGPRFFHFVIGGVTPAALAADWTASLLDQNPGLWLGSPLGTRLETIALGWLKEMFGVPASWGGVLVTGATMANYTALAAARHWWAERLGRDVETDGLMGLPETRIFSSGYVHASSVKAIGMLGMGQSNLELLTKDDTGALDLAALEDRLKGFDGKPAIVIANAGEVNTGAFDPIAEMADLAEKYGAWLHVDGAFGLFAALSPRTEHLVEGIDRVNSITSDAHKWMNVPYDCGFVFVRDPEILAKAFRMTAAAYLVRSEDKPDLAFMSPESSRRARSLPLWATLKAYGRTGYAAMVERHLDLAQRVAARVDEADDLERMADVPLNIVCFRYRPPSAPDGSLNDLNARLGKAILADGRVYVGTTTYRGMTCFRPAIVNWRTQERDVDLLVDVVRELGGGSEDQLTVRFSTSSRTRMSAHPPSSPRHDLH